MSYSKNNSDQVNRVGQRKEHLNREAYKSFGIEKNQVEQGNGDWWVYVENFPLRSSSLK